MKRLQEIYIRSADPFERGRQHGSQVVERIHSICKNYMDSFAAKGYTWEEAKEMAMEYYPLLKEQMPDLLMEAEGIATGAGIDLATVLVLNTRYELLKFPKKQDGSPEHECTVYCITPDATAQKETLAGQNWDNAPFIGENLYVLHIDEENGTKIVGLCEPAQLIRNGMNSHGLSLSCATLLSTLDKPGIAIPSTFLRRRLLQCKTLEEAEALITSFKPYVSLSYSMASRQGEAFLYETNPGENYKIYPTAGILAHGNDFVVNPLIERFIPADNHHVHHFRGQRLGYLLGKKRGSIDEFTIIESLADHEGFPGSICDHTTDEGYMTIASTIYCLNRGYALICWGRPCQGVEYFELYNL